MCPFQNALPVATRNWPLAGSITAPERPKMAESDCGQLGGESSWCVPEHSEFQIPSTAPVASEMTTT